ncbi:hypothetical protein ACF0H5_022002 [Mactra antiquata]
MDSFRRSAVLLLLITQDSVLAQTYEQADELMNDLKVGYNKYVVPVNNQSSTVYLSVSLHVYSIPDIDAINGLVTFSVAFYSSWRDAKLQWKPMDYGGLDTMILRTSEVWTPAFLVVSSIDQSIIGAHTIGHIMFQSTGTVHWYPSHMIKNTCSFNMKYWPFDKQHCIIEITERSYGSGKIFFRTFNDEHHALITSGVALSEWELENTFIEINNLKTFPFIRFHFKLRRIPTFYVLTTILPLVMIGFLIPFVFLLPSEAGERVGFSVTMMLSLTVSMTVISENIPSTSNPMARVCGYVTLLILSSVLVTMATIVNLYIYHRRTNNDISNFWRKLCCLGGLANRVGVVVGPSRHRPEATGKESNGDDVTSLASQQSECILQWTDVSHSIDRILFVSTMVLSYSSSISFLIYLISASDYPNDVMTFSDRY